MIVTVSNLMLQNIHTAEPLDSLRKAQLIMSKERISCLPIIENNKVVGILTIRDIMNSHPNRIIADAMSHPVISISPNCSLWEANEIFDTYHFGNLPVIENDTLCGLLSRAVLCAELGKYIDLLTGLYQRHYLLHKGIELLNKGKDLSIIFIDVNKFGDINKEYGHVIGDAIIKDIALILKDKVPANYILCRYGGDEFAMLTCDCLEYCRNLASNILSSISHYSFYNNIEISACAGIASLYKQEHKSPDMLLDMLSETINKASLASSQAKKLNQHIVVAAS